MVEFPIPPLPKWVILPGDPEALKEWLRARAAEDGTSTKRPPDTRRTVHDDRP